MGQAECFCKRGNKTSGSKIHGGTSCLAEGLKKEWNQLALTTTIFLWLRLVLKKETNILGVK
jgi:hypothetical protein